MKVLSALILVILILTAVILPGAYAAEATSGDYVYAIGSKFGRGLTNIVTSPAEVPCNIAIDMKEKTYQGFFTGTGKGLLFFLRRAFVGITEIATFVIPMDPTIPQVCAKQPSANTAKVA